MENRAPEDPLLKSARREALVVLLTWLCAGAYTVTYCYRYGYYRSADDLRFVLGFPDWVFWGIVIPWSACFVVSYWFSYVFMTDEHLGEERDEADEEWLSSGEAPDA
jgi:phosphatidylserine synthase